MIIIIPQETIIKVILEDSYTTRAPEILLPIQFLLVVYLLNLNLIHSHRHQVNPRNPVRTSKQSRDKHLKVKDPTRLCHQVMYSRPSQLRKLQLLKVQRKGRKASHSEILTINQPKLPRVNRLHNPHKIIKINKPKINLPFNLNKIIPISKHKINLKLNLSRLIMIKKLKIRLLPNPSKLKIHLLTSLSKLQISLLLHLRKLQISLLLHLRNLKISLLLHLSKIQINKPKTKLLLKLSKLQILISKPKVNPLLYLSKAQINKPKVKLLSHLNQLQVNRSHRSSPSQINPTHFLNLINSNLLRNKKHGI